MSSKRKILIVEDDRAFGTMLKRWFDKNGYEPTLVITCEQALKEIDQSLFDLILTDLRLPDGEGTKILSNLHGKTPVIIMTGYGEVQSAVASIKLGAFDYLEKPIQPEILKQKIDQALSNSSHSKKKSIDPNILIGNSKTAVRLYDHIKIVAPTQLSVLIKGESGTGKESTALLIHQLSKRKAEPFLAVDCGSLSKDLAPSELFGHLKGSFTSAVADKKGVFEMAAGGTVFLDEIGNLSYDVQVQLLRTLQERRVRPVGAATDVPVDIRIIAATNENLQSAITAGRFREDLYHRLNEFSIEVPPLRERGSDIPLFAEHFLRQANIELDKQVNGFSEESIDILKQYSWPGNLRELRNTVRRAALFARSALITPDNLPQLLPADLDSSLILQAKNEKEQIETALQVAKGNKALAARLLKIDRKTLYNRMHQLGMR